jgi:hypothetical protein
MPLENRSLNEVFPTARSRSAVGIIGSAISIGIALCPSIAGVSIDAGKVASTSSGAIVDYVSNRWITVAIADALKVFFSPHSASWGAIKIIKNLVQGGDSSDDKNH